MRYVVITEYAIERYLEPSRVIIGSFGIKPVPDTKHL